MRVFVSARASISVCVCIFVSSMGGVSYLVVCYHGRSVPATERERNGEREARRGWRVKKMSADWATASVRVLMD